MRIARNALQWVIELLLLTSLGTVAPLRFLLPLYRINPHPTKKTPIVIVENWFLQNPYHFLLKRRLESKGFAVYLFNHTLLKGGLDDGAKQLQRFINEQKIHDCILVGISIGSIPCLTYLREHQGWRHVKKLITLGGPLRGTPAMLPFAYLKSGKQVLPGSDFLKKFHPEHMTHPERIICISAKKDELVPGWSSFLPHSKHIILDVVGHNYLHILAKETVAIIAKEAEE